MAENQREAAINRRSYRPTGMNVNKASAATSVASAINGINMAAIMLARKRNGYGGVIPAAAWLAAAARRRSVKYLALAGNSGGLCVASWLGGGCAALFQAAKCLSNRRRNESWRLFWHP